MIEDVIVGFASYTLYAYITFAIARWGFRTQTSTALWIAGGFALIRAIFVVNRAEAPGEVRGALFIASLLVIAVLAVHGLIAWRLSTPRATPSPIVADDLNEVR